MLNEAFSTLHILRWNKETESLKCTSNSESINDLGWKRPLEGICPSTGAQSRAARKVRLLRALSSQVPSIFEDADSTTFPINLFQCVTILCESFPLYLTRIYFVTIKCCPLSFCCTLRRTVWLRLLYNRPLGS